MKYNIIHSQPANDDMQSIIKYIAKESYNRAIDFKIKLDDKISNLAKSPYIGTMATSRNFILPDSRFIVCKPYLIFYTVSELDSTIIFERVIHSAQENY